MVEFNKINCSIFFCLVVLQTNAQNVGIGTTTPIEKLEVVGNLKFTQALMPAGVAGSVGQVLISQGPRWCEHSARVRYHCTKPYFLCLGSCPHKTINTLLFRGDTNQGRGVVNYPL